MASRLLIGPSEATDVQPPGEAPDKPDGPAGLFVSYETLSALLDQSLSLQKGLQPLIVKRRRCNEIDTVEVKKVVTAACTAIEQQVRALRDIVHPFPRRPENVESAATETLRLPELLERILLQLSPANILRAQKVATVWRDIVNTSPSIQVVLGLAPNNSGHFYTPLGHLDYRFKLRRGTRHGLKNCEGSRARCVWIQKRMPPRPDLLFVCFHLYFGRSFVELGDRCRAMLLCYPPVKKGEIVVSGRDIISRRQAHKRVAIERDDGITVGDVFDMAKEAFEDSKYLTWREVCMNAEIELRDDDPELQSVQEYEALLDRAAVEHEERMKRAFAGPIESFVATATGTDVQSPDKP